MQWTHIACSGVPCSVRTCMHILSHAVGDIAVVFRVKFGMNFEALVADATLLERYVVSAVG